MESVFEFSNYRDFMGRFYESRKKTNSNFSFRIFSDLCGFKDKSVVSNIIRGRINLSLESIRRVSNAMELAGPQRTFFETLVRFNQAKSLDDKNRFFKKLDSIKKQGVKISPAQKLRKEQYEYYSSVYHSTVRSILDLYPFKGEWAWLAKMVYPGIKPLQAKKSVQLLESLGLVKKGSDGVFRVTEKNIEAGRDVLDIGIANYHLDSANLAAQALKTPSNKKKVFAGQTLGISEKSRKKIMQEIDKFQDRLAIIAGADIDADTVFRLNFQMFQTSENGSKKRKLK